MKFHVFGPKTHVFPLFITMKRLIRHSHRCFIAEADVFVVADVFGLASSDHVESSVDSKRVDIDDLFSNAITGPRNFRGSILERRKAHLLDSTLTKFACENPP